MSKLIHYSGPNGTILLRQGLERLAWLQGDGTAYIDTGWKYTSGDMTIDIEYTMPRRNGTTILGSSNDNTKWCTLIYCYSGSRAHYCGTLSGHYSKVTPADTKVHEVYGISGSNAFVKDERYNPTTKTGWTSSCGTIPSQNYTYLVYAHHYGNSIAQVSDCKIYHLHIWDRGTLVRSYIPVRVKSAITIAGTSYAVGAVGLYDQVNDKLYTNAASSGGFIAGPECPQGFPTSEYCQVEWLEGTGTQWIDTEITCGSTDVVNTIWTMDATNGNGQWQGINGQMQMLVNAGSVSDGVNSITISGLTNVEYNYNNGTSTLKVGSTSKTRSWGARDAQSIYLWKLSNYNGSLVTCKISRFQATKGGTKVRDMIACYRRSDMKPGMYDLISRTFLTNRGTGEFLLGPSITFGWGEVRNGTADKRLKMYQYLQSDGSAYIDTGIKFNSSNRLNISLDCQYINTYSGSGIDWIAGWDYGGQLGRSNNTTWSCDANTTSTITTTDRTYITEEINPNTQITTYQISTATTSVSMSRSFSNSNLTTYGGKAGYPLFCAFTQTDRYGRATAQRIYSFKMYQNGVMIRDLHPASLDGVYGMYDALNDVFYSNAGSGLFTVGPETTCVSDKYAFHAIPHNISRGEGRNGKNTAFELSTTSASYLSVDKSALNSCFSKKTWTMAMWIKIANTNRHILVGDMSTSYPFNWEYLDGKIRAYFNGSPDKTGNKNIPVNEWHHIAIAVNASGFKMYMDGQLDAEHTSAPTQGQLADNMLIGSDSRTTQIFGGCWIQDFQLFDEYLDQTAIQQLM